MGKRKMGYIIGAISGALGGVLGAWIGSTIGFRPVLIGISAAAVILVIALIVWRLVRR